VFFAEADVVNAVGWVQIVVQLGGVGIMGWFLIKTVPMLHEKIAETQLRMMEMFQSAAAAERQGFDSRTKDVVAELHRLGDAIPKGLENSVSEMNMELKGQSAILEKQTMQMENMAEQVTKQTEMMDVWPSDPARLCQAMAIVKELNVDATLDDVKKVLEKLQTQAARKR
jgi:uncharacterized protein YoxC